MREGGRRYGSVPRIVGGGVAEEGEFSLPGGVKEREEEVEEEYCSGYKEELVEYGIRHLILKTLIDYKGTAHQSSNPKHETRRLIPTRKEEHHVRCK